MLEKEGPETPLLDRSNAFFKCPYCGTKYEMTTAHLSFKQRSYAKCQVCNQTMCSWNSRNVPIFTLMNASKGETPASNPNSSSGLMHRCAVVVSQRTRSRVA
jgi:hypothetical protein